MNDKDLLSVIQEHKLDCLKWRMRRHMDWTENYTLYRDKVLLNRLTQRQSVNIPLMKYHVKTLLANVDEPPIMYFLSLNNNDQQELYYNEHFKEAMDKNQWLVKDIIDKKQVFLYGRSFKKLNITNGRFTFSIEDPQDILIQRYTDPSDIDSARVIIHEHIFKPLASLDQNDFYDKKAIKNLKSYYATEQGLIEATDVYHDLEDRNLRMMQLGVPDVMTPTLGETYIELNEVYLYRYDPAKKKEVIFLIVVAGNAGDEGSEVLVQKPLYEVIGETKDSFWDNHFPISWWGDDPERTDIWSDGIADILRTPNKVLNSWMSQIVENRTMRNFGMTFYDASNPDFVPQTFAPVPFGFYPVPGDPSKILQPVVIPDLSNTMDEMNFIMDLSEKATAASATQQGQIEQRQVTLGEVQMALGEAKERVESIAMFYNQGWKDFGFKYIKLLEAAGDMLDPLPIVRKGRLGKKMYTREVSPKDWESDLGYTLEIKMKANKESDDSNALQKLNAAHTVMPNNIPLNDIYKKKLLEFADLTADEMEEVLKFEQEQEQQPPPGPAIQPKTPAESIAYKDAPPQAQAQMLQQAGLNAQAPDNQPGQQANNAPQQSNMPQAQMQLPAGGAMPPAQA